MKAIVTIALAASLIAPMSSFAQSAYSQYGAQQQASPTTRSSYESQNTQPVHVSGYERANGTYVQPYERTTPNSTRSDNYSTKGNVNPYTGKAGTRDPYSSGGY